MFRRLALVLLITLAACAAPAAPLPSVTPPPTVPVLPTLPPVAPTILASDLGKAPTTQARNQPAAAPTPTPAPPATPATVDFDFALRPQFAADLKRTTNKTVYTMNWNFNDDLSEMQGTQRTILANRTGERLNEIYFRLFANYPNSKGSIEIKNVRVGGDMVDSELVADDTALKIKLSRPLTAARPVPITFDYTVSIPRDNETRYGDFTRTDWLTTLPTIYPIVPGYDDKGWHLEVPPPYGDLVFADSSVYDVTINAPSKYNVIASGELVQETNEGDRTVRRFIGAPMRDFDANLTDTLTLSSAMVEDVKVNSWYLPAHTESGQRALEWSSNALRVFEKRFGAYPFKELDVVESPTTAGGIEYPGVITVASNLYADPGQLSFFEFATVHETAHQWFYSTIGNDQVNHPWLDEALTQYATLIYFQDQYGADTARTIQENFFDVQYEGAKSRFGDMPAGLPVSAYTEDEYGAFVYAKGPKFFQAVRDQIGDAAFFQALRTYYDQFKFGIAQPSDLLKTFNTASGQDITPLFEKWIGG